MLASQKTASSQSCHRLTQDSPLPLTYDFAIIGAQKTGTTSLAHYMLDHPQLCSGSEEWTIDFNIIDFMRLNKTQPGSIDRWVEKYRNLSSSRLWEQRSYCAAEKVRRSHANDDIGGCHLFGFSRPMLSYLAISHAEWLHRAAPSLRLVFLVREPIQRALSAWRMAWRSTTIHTTFDSLVASGMKQLDRKERTRQTSDVVRRGLYAEQIEAYLRFFAPQQLHIGISERFRDGLDEYNRLFAFLGVGNLTSLPRQTASEAHAAKTDQNMTDATMRRLYAYYRPATLVLYRDYLGEALSEWESWYRKHGIADTGSRCAHHGIPYRKREDSARGDDGCLQR